MDSNRTRVANSVKISMISNDFEMSLPNCQFFQVCECVLFRTLSFVLEHFTYAVDFVCRCVCVHAKVRKKTFAI